MSYVNINMHVVSHPLKIGLWSLPGLLVVLGWSAGLSVQLRRLLGSSRDFPDGGPAVGAGTLLSDGNVVCWFKLCGSIVCVWVVGAEEVVAVGAAVVSFSLVTAVVAGLKVVELDVGAAVVAWMVEGAAVDRWVDHACALVVQALLVEDWDGGTAAGKTHKENLGLSFN